MPIEWSTQQKAIFNWFSEGAGNLVVRARAGTGKTTVIIEGINRAPERNILLAAFNKDIAEELKTRLKNPRAEAKTLHSLGFGMIRRHWSRVRVDGDRGMRLARAAAGGEDAPGEMVGFVRKLASVAKGSHPNPLMEQLIDWAYDYDCDPDEEWEKDGWTVERIARSADKALRLACESDGAIDFDDMVYLPVKMGWLRGTYDLIVVDEVQDLAPMQIALALGSIADGGRIAVIGDDRQAIYGFRGADSGSIDRLKLELGAVEMGLTITRRCPTKVVDLARRLVPDFEAAPNAPSGTITDIGEHELVARAQIGDFILSRKNAPLAGICLRILRNGTRARIKGRDIGASIVNLVKKIAKGPARDDIGVFLERLDSWTAKECKRYALAGKQGKVDEATDKADMISALADGLTTPSELVNRVEELFSDAAQKQPCVMLSSIHKAKGLEADRVFVLMDTLYPRKSEDLQEERNLEYVAITRSRDTLIRVRVMAASVPILTDKADAVKEVVPA